ncbi:hypothetical protein [Corynebacterium sp. 13CS0277]|uniref:hypothetical protein n=1 Tax=Corynebacterium sp. 13CS0277 TaxID=2071994 RepID=UPI0011B24D82|nr:hypothetical protein [Corynebacterium sp. 13CS0277]
MARIPTFIDFLIKKDANGEPWVPPWKFSLIGFPLFTFISFVMDELTGFGGMVFPNREPKSLSEIDWSSTPHEVAAYMPLYYFGILPIFFLKRHYWRKRHASEE